MKYAIVSYERKYLCLNGRDTQNVGDWMQTIAMEFLYKEWGVKDYIFISRNDASKYEGEYVILPYNGFNTLVDRVGYKTRTFPLSPKIIPVFFSMHFHDHFMPEEMKKQLIQFAPIGCRDEETLENMRSHGIMAYLSGCITALLPRRSSNPIIQNKILLVDAPVGIENYMPKYLLERTEYYSHMFPINRTTGSHYMTEEESKETYCYTRNLLEYYRDNAALVITSRLHVASPCMAMGIPVILARNDFDGRYAWIDKYLPLYTKENWDKINWNPQPIEYEKEKNILKEILRKELTTAYENYKEIYGISEFYENRERIEYNRRIKIALQNLKIQGSHFYALWGVVKNTLLLKNVIEKELPNLHLEKVYDLSVEGKFEGITIEKPDKIDKDNDFIYFIVARKARTTAEKSLEKGMYVFVDFDSEDWENNIIKGEDEFEI